MGGDSATVYSNPQVTIGPISVDASGALATGLESSGEITLTNDDVRILENATVWIGPRLTLHSSNGQEVSLTASDSLTVVGYIDVEYFVDGEL